MNELKLHSNIYSMIQVEKAAKAYRDICQIKINKNGNYIICEFTNCFYDKNETISEFKNYIIDLMNTDIAL